MPSTLRSVGSRVGSGLGCVDPHPPWAFFVSAESKGLRKRVFVSADSKELTICERIGRATNAFGSLSDSVFYERPTLEKGRPCAEAATFRVENARGLEIREQGKAV